jgi:tripartite-type tricarboxylate transporter receptor subunit TctC
MKRQASISGAAVFLAASLLAAASFVPSAATAQSYPSRPVKIIVAFSPGTGIDILAREAGQQLSQRLHQPFVVENRPGASGNLGMALVAKAEPDGYTVSVIVNTFVMNAALYNNLPFDSVRDFSSVGLMARGGLALVVNSNVKASNTRELIEQAKREPGKLNYASPGVGTPQHLAMELLKNAAGIDIVHIPHKGAAEALTAMLGGQTDVMVMPVHTTLPHVKSGKLRVLAVAGATRNPLMPQAPTIGESAGIPGFEVDLWYGMLAPARTPPDVIDKLNAELRVILADEAMRTKLSAQGLQLTSSSPEVLAELIKSDIPKWSKVIKAAGIMPE